MLFVFVLISALLIKHYLADFVFQPAWMLKGKGRLTAPGGYAHAALHAAGSGLILGMAGMAATPIAMVMAAEFVVHYTIDFAKDRITAYSSADSSPYLYWQLHGFDQLAHQMTYVAIAWVAMTALG
jgi:hypothetical protein